MNEFPLQFTLPLFFRLTIRRKRKPGTTQPFYLYIIHEHSMMHMIHELLTFVDRVKCLTQIHYLIWNVLQYKKKKLLCSLFLPGQSVYYIHFNSSFDHESPCDYRYCVTLFLSVFTRAFTFTFLCPLSISLELFQTSASFGYCFL